VRPQRRTEALGFAASLVDEIALCGALAEFESGRIADARGRETVSDEHDLAAFREQRPKRVVCPRGDRNREKHERNPAAHHAGDYALHRDTVTSAPWQM
jgi:hypothetical protein